VAALLLLRQGHASTSVSCGELCGVPTSLSKHVSKFGMTGAVGLVCVEGYHCC